MFFAPFLVLYAILFLGLLTFVFVVVQIGIIHYAFEVIGLPHDLAFAALLASLIGSYINIPITRVEGGAPAPLEVVGRFGVRYRVPARYATGETTLAINVGGAIVPVLISLYVLAHQPAALIPALTGIVVVAMVVHRFARPVPGLGIATPMFIPPLIAATAAILLTAFFATGARPDAVAYVCGVMGTLIGADLLNLRKLRDLGAPVASIGGAGTFDGVFLTGIVAVLLA
jgi:uncharacterized membrane protein